MSTQNVTGQATRRQTWAIFCATRCDVRGLNLSVEVASEILDAVNAGEDVRGRLANLGADVSAAQVPAEVRNREHAALFDRAWKAVNSLHELLLARGLGLRQWSRDLFIPRSWR